jgi:hypothetical protein
MPKRTYIIVPVLGGRFHIISRPTISMAASCGVTEILVPELLFYGNREWNSIHRSD